MQSAPQIEDLWNTGLERYFDVA